MKKRYDAIIVGSGPNGLAAAVRLAQQGMSVKVIEAKATIGGGTRTQELTLPDFKHDVCSAVHPMAAVSPYFQQLPLEEHGLKWIYPELAVAHPMDQGPAVLIYKSLEKTAAELGEDEKAYKKLLAPIVQNFEKLVPMMLAPFNPLPKNPFLLAGFGLKALRPARQLAFSKFKNERTRALFAGVAAHSIQPLENIASSAIGLVLSAAAHAKGWPIPEGGSHRITTALASYFKQLGGEIETGREIRSLKELQDGKLIFFNLTPKQILNIAREKIPSNYASKLAKYRYGAGVFKVDLALSEPVPWKDKRCLKAGTVHLGGTFDEIAQGEKLMAKGQHTDNPYVLVAQQSLFDHRAPEGKHTLWAYCHVPHGSTKDMTAVIENQIERYAPGFKDTIIGRATMNTTEIENYDSNYIGGDINGGVQDIKQLFHRPVKLFNPYHIPDTNFYICSSSVPPGGGVHGMGGYHAAESAIKKHKCPIKT